MPQRAALARLARLEKENGGAWVRERAKTRRQILHRMVELGWVEHRRRGTSNWAASLFRLTESGRSAMTRTNTGLFTVKLTVDERRALDALAVDAESSGAEVVRALIQFARRVADGDAGHQGSFDWPEFYESIQKEARDALKGGEPRARAR